MITGAQLTGRVHPGPGGEERGPEEEAVTVEVGEWTAVSEASVHVAEAVVPLTTVTRTTTSTTTTGPDGAAGAGARRDAVTPTKGTRGTTRTGLLAELNPGSGTAGVRVTENPGTEPRRHPRSSLVETCMFIRSVEQPSSLICVPCLPEKLLKNI